MNGLTVSVSPHVRSGNSTTKVMGDVIIAMIPVLLMSVYHFGLRSLLLVLISAATCVVCEFLWEKLRHEEITVMDLSAVVTGMMLAFNVPASMPIWKLMVGDVVAIIVVKMLFGGIGCNFMNPALVGRVVLFVSFTGDMTNYSFSKHITVDALSSATPLAVLDKLSLSDLPALLIGNQGGVIGEVSACAILLGFIYLIVRKVIRPVITLAYLGSALLFSFLFGADQPVLALFSGGLMFGAVFMATDYVTSPFTDKGKLIFGLGCGFLTAAIRCFSNSAGGVSFAILIMNLLVPYINDLTVNKPFGGVETK